MVLQTIPVTSSVAEHVLTGRNCIYGMDTTRVLNKKLIETVKREHPDWGVKRISRETKLPPSTVRYHLSNQVKSQTIIRVKKFRKLKRFSVKLSRFRERKKNFDRAVKGRRSKLSSRFTAKMLWNKLKSDPVCYLTGTPIDLLSDDYAFDHTIPVSKGGDNSLLNLGLTCKPVNKAKADFSYNEFVAMCLKVVKHAGYAVTLGCVTGVAPAQS